MRLAPTTTILPPLLLLLMLYSSFQPARVSAPAIWVYTTTSRFNRFGGSGYAAFLDDAQRLRLERIRQARLLYAGRHREYFLDEQRTQFTFPPTMDDHGRVQTTYITYNVLGLVSLKTSDLMFGQDPLLRVDDEVQQARLTELTERTALHELLKQTAVECSYEGEAFLEAVKWRGRVYLQRVPADEMFGVGPITPDGQYERFVRYQLANVGTADVPAWLLLEVTYEPGVIRREAWALLANTERGGRVDLSRWPTPDGLALEAETRTGIDRNTVTWIPNELDHGRPVSDYDGLIELQDTLNAKQTQLGRVLAQHADPAMSVRQDLADEQGNVRHAYKVFFHRDGGAADDAVKYLTWDPHLESALADRSFTLNSLLILAEMSPALLGLKEGAAPDAYKKLRLEATNALAMAQRKAATWRPRIRRAVAVCQDLEQTIPGQRYDRHPLAVELRDGIPVDDGDQANTIATLRSASAMSRRRAVEVQLVDAAAVEKELAELAKEDEQRTPSVFMTHPGGGEAGEDAGGDTATAAAAGAGSADDNVQGANTDSGSEQR